MFPSNPWKDISNEGRRRMNFTSIDRLVSLNFSSLALSFLQSLLELDSKKRLLINKVFLQPWLQVDLLECLFECI